MVALTRTYRVAHVFRVEVVLVPTTATVHELLTRVVLRVEVPAWGLSLAWADFHGLKANVPCTQQGNKIQFFIVQK
jgi:hypothetical protein